MSTWLSKMNNGGMSGGMKVKEPIVPGLNTSAAKVSKTKAAVNTAKIAADGDEAVTAAQTEENNNLANKLKKERIAAEGQKALDKADAKDVADTSYVTNPTPGKIAPMVAAAAINAIASKKK